MERIGKVERVIRTGLAAGTLAGSIHALPVSAESDTNSPSGTIFFRSL